MAAASRDKMENPIRFLIIEDSKPDAVLARQRESRRNGCVVFADAAESSWTWTLR